MGTERSGRILIRRADTFHSPTSSEEWKRKGHKTDTRREFVLSGEPRFAYHGGREGSDVREEVVLHV